MTDLTDTNATAQRLTDQHEARAREVATTVADRCQGDRKPGQAPQRYAYIWQAARLGALEVLCSADERTAALAAENERLQKALKPVLEAAVPLMTAVLSRDARATLTAANDLNTILPAALAALNGATS